jgi:peptidoglycan/xylan/chitin deacetylase (PgdA/CDA1 family)
VEVSMSGFRRVAAGGVRRLRHVRPFTVEAIARARHRVPSGCVALTFDDGPHPQYTAAVLDVLAEMEVKATFFCVGRNAYSHPQLIRHALAEGHAIGSHSMTHPHPAEISAQRAAEEYAAGRRAVTAVAGRAISLFRPPHGHMNLAHAIAMRRTSLQPWLWTVDPEDWRPGASRDAITATAGRAESGDVILLHDWVEQPWAPAALNRSATVGALPGIVRALRNKGLRFITLPA